MTVLDDGLGALFIGLVLSTLLHGVTLSQAWHFFSSQSRQFQDPLGLKTLVAVVVALDFIHQVCTSHWLYKTFVTNYGHLEELTKLPPCAFFTRPSVLLLTVTINLQELSGNGNTYGVRYLPSTEFLRVAHMEMAQHPDSAQFTGTMTKIVIAVNGMGAGIDVLIALSMVFLLTIRKTRVVRTNRMLRQIAIYSVTTGAATSICAIGVFVTAITLPGANYVLMFYLMLTRMYSNSLLATLNVRESLRSTGSSGTGGAITDSALVSHPQFSNPTTVARGGGSFRLNDLKRVPSDHEGISIKVDRRTEVSGGL
ncbi:hypothetical protein V5O48_007762 [Marasmius crinis-equi]|uniref:DUF6534 domain-containing protein n=1 Tax=Marasmius crinis-equi TaxID=585013 RepID=A0ABR3F2P1_9AGAR